MPRPRDAAAFARSPSSSRVRSPMKAVLHELASAVRNGIRPVAAARVVVVVLEVGTVDVDRRRCSRRGRRGVRPRRSSARLLTLLNVEPGAYWPKVARFWPPLPGPLAAARIAPSLGRIATRALAGPTSASSVSASDCSSSSRVSDEGLALGRLGAEQLALLAVAADGVDDDARRALELLVVAGLQAGQPGAVADLVALGVVLDHLGGDRPDACRGSAAAKSRVGARGTSAATRTRALDGLVAGEDRSRQVVLAVHDGLDERPLAGGLDLRDVGRRVDVDQLGPAPAADGAGAGRRDLAPGRCRPARRVAR